MLARKLTSIGAAETGFNPEDGLVLTRTVPPGMTTFSGTEKANPVVMACEVTFPASPAEGCLFEEGASAQGAFVGLRDGGSLLRIRAGDGGRFNTGDDPRGAFYIDFVAISDTEPHTLVWEFDPTPGVNSVRAWIDGFELGPAQGGGGNEMRDWAGFASGTYAVGGGGPRREPTGPWPGTVLSDLRVYAGQTAGFSKPADFVTFSNTSPFFRNEALLLSPLDATTTVENVYTTDISCDEPITIEVNDVRANLADIPAAYKISIDGGAYQSLASPLTIPAGQYSVSVAVDFDYPADRHARINSEAQFLFNGYETGFSVLIEGGRNLLCTVPSLNAVIPAGVTSIDAVAIGSGGEVIWANPSSGERGGAGGGALSYTNGIAVTPGETLTAEYIMSTSFGNTGFDFSSRYSALKRGSTFLLKAEAGHDPLDANNAGASGGRASAGVGAVRYSGGNGGNGSSSLHGGCGGAAGYSGNGGNGASGFSAQGTPGANGSGGGGAGGSNDTWVYAIRGGGVWYAGQGVSGVGNAGDAGGRGSRPGEEGTTKSPEYGGGEYSGDNGCVYFSY